MDIYKAKEVLSHNNDDTRCLWHRDTNPAIEWAIAEIERRAAIPHGSRRAEVDEKLISCRNVIDRGHLARTLADEVDELQQACNEMQDELSKLHQLELEAKCHGDLEESHKIMVDVVAERDAEIDELRGKLDDVRMGIGCARGQRTTQYCAEAVARDEIIGKLLTMLRPGEKPNCMDPKYNPSKMPPLTEYNLDCMWHEMRKQTHARALEVTGRKE